MDGTQYVPQEKAGRIAWLLAKGAQLNSHEVAALLGITRGSANVLLNTLSRVCPIYRDQDGKWSEAPSPKSWHLS